MLRCYALLPSVLPLLLTAQPVLQETMVDPNGATLDLYMVGSMGTAQQPTGGANQVWDLSSMQLNNAGTVDFIPAAATPYAASYPTANWAWVVNIIGFAADHTYLTVNSTHLEMVAEKVPSSPNLYADPRTILVFPMTYGQTAVDTYNDNDGPGSITWTYAGYGTTVLPMGTFTNTVLLTSDQGDVFIWNTTPLRPLVLYDLSSSLFFVPGSVGVNELHANAALTAIPNPCTDVLNVQLPANTAWRISDLQGRTMRSGRSTSAAQRTIPVEALAPGAYALLLDEAGTTRSLRFVKQ